MTSITTLVKKLKKPETAEQNPPVTKHVPPVEAPASTKTESRHDDRIFLAAIKALTPMVVAEINNPTRSALSIEEALRTRLNSAYHVADHYLEVSSQDLDKINNFERFKVLDYAIDLTSKAKASAVHTTAAMRVAEELDEEQLLVLGGTMDSQALASRMFPAIQREETKNQISLCVTKGAVSILSVLANDKNTQDELQVLNATNSLNAKILAHTQEYLANPIFSGASYRDMGFQFMNRYNAGIEIAKAVIGQIRADFVKNQGGWKLDAALFDVSVLTKGTEFDNRFKTAVSALDAIVNSHMERINQSLGQHEASEAQVAAAPKEASLAAESTVAPTTPSSEEDRKAKPQQAVTSSGFPKTIPASLKLASFSKFRKASAPGRAM